MAGLVLVSKEKVKAIKAAVYIATELSHLTHPLQGTKDTVRRFIWTIS